ncbi:SDR family NAD(P)-dependent oxidoreductase [Amycolatopsis sp., V23-08]|uniref:SDR family NAD(P)-dependent oxidoreductase n=1 Tax=Amycolatopsis heterodermiae TaxID=3110235 RepID=A0ABU5R5K2_9PSEU|nr:SDR family NAD(P)-dependent oxidoreductase [Amycolatopsis sp., V23-08]MEA5360919.1 SDR family NAD(P)-dependent oxidoreductase [Amycolatopsis sp., V23-08]
MTGATRGIGLEAAKDLLRRSLETHLVLLGRESLAARALPVLRTGSPHVSAIGVDLANKAGIRIAAAEIEDLLDAGELPALAGIVCNAGVHLSSALRTSDDGYELTFAVNVLATHLLLRRLQPHLRAPARIVVTVSDAHFGDLRHTGGTMPAPRWKGPAPAASAPTPRASSQRSTSSTNGPVACPTGSTSSPTTRASSPAPDWPRKRAARCRS